MSFSIVMLTWNNCEKLKVSIESMYHYLYSPEILEIIILDNGSDEKEIFSYLQQIESCFEKIEVIYSKENLGISKGRKRLYELARGEYIISLDSDIKFLDPCYLIETLTRNLKPLPWESSFEGNETLFMIGGGGGNHPNYPSIYMEDIVNEINRDKKNEFVIVDEVAGWCQCFRKSLLEKVKMDIQFSPFWGEDSDFCIQIKKLGGKCAILGRGIIDHKFSSCRDLEKRKPLKKMWEKLVQKWFLEETFDFPFDKIFYSNFYNSESPVQDFFSSKNGGTPGIFNLEKYRESPEKQHFSFKYSGWGSINGGNVYIVNGDSEYPKGETAIIINGRYKENSILLNTEYSSKYYQNILIHVFEYIKEYDFEKIIMIGFEDNMNQLNPKLNRKGISHLLRGETKNTWENSGEYDFKIVKNISESYPIKKMRTSLQNLPGDYNNVVCPEYSPVHIFPKLFENMYDSYRDYTDKILSIVIGESLQKIDIPHGKILYIDVDTCVNEIPTGSHYMQRMENFSLREMFHFLDSPSAYFVYEYDIICVYDVRKIEMNNWSWSDEFIERSLYQNQIYVENDPTIFSFGINDLDDIIKIDNFITENAPKIQQKINLEKTFYINIFKKIHFTPVWRRKTVKNMDSEDLIHYRDDEDQKNLKDFPLTYIF